MEDNLNTYIDDSSNSTSTSKPPKTSNRLNLNFSIPYTDERAEFITDYLNSKTFEYSKPTNAELETMANYILWGKQRSNDKNVVQDRLIDIPTRSKTWDRAQKTESLDALLAQPTFNEQQLNSLNGPRYKYPKETFSRSEARKLSDDDQTTLFNDLWKRIDTLELELNYYDLIHGKRSTEPRAQLVSKFTESEIDVAKANAAQLNQFKYLKKRHLLVELRREQFTLRDSIKPILLPHQTNSVSTYDNGPTEFDSDILCAPIGLKYKTDLCARLFSEDRYPIPSDFKEEELASIISMYWARKQHASTTLVFDFQNPTHVGEVFSLWEALNDTEDTTSLTTTPEFIDTLKYYINKADLTDVQRFILDAKLARQSNADISHLVNKQYNKSYTINYISTIFRQKIIPSICAAASSQAEVIENLPYPENFKKCKTCGRVLLCSPTNFVRKTRSPDGFSTQCKKCDRLSRAAAKEKIKPLYYIPQNVDVSNDKNDIGV